MLSLCAEQVSSVLRNLNTLLSTLTARSAETREAATLLATEIDDVALPFDLLTRVLPPPADVQRVPPLALPVSDALALARSQARAVAAETARLAGLLASVTSAAPAWVPAGASSAEAAAAVAAATAAAAACEGHWGQGTNLAAALAGTATYNAGSAAASEGLSFFHADASDGAYEELTLRPAPGGAAPASEPASPLVALPDLPAQWAGDGAAVRAVQHSRKLVAAATRKPVK
jgi:hypothetical protein